MFFEDSFDLKLLFIFLGFAINWIGGFAGFLRGEVLLSRNDCLPWLRFCGGLMFVFLFVGFAWDCVLSTIFGLMGLLGWFEIIFNFSGLLRGFINNGFLSESSLEDFPFKEEARGDLSSLFCW